MAGELKYRHVPLGQVDLGYSEIELLVKTIRNNRISHGPLTRELEGKLADLHGVKHCILMASGTCALQVGLRALKEIRGWDDDAEVIIPATTFIATMSAVLDAGLKPVLVDVDRRNYNLDPSCIADVITNNTAAVLPVHLLGEPCWMPGIKQAAKTYNLDIVEDCCEAVGVTFQGQPVGSFGAFGAISTYVCHHLTTGVGGAVLTSDDNLATICRSLIQFGRDPAYLSMDDKSGDVLDRRYRFQRWGYSYRTTELNSAVGLAQFKNLKWCNERRREVASRLKDALAPLEVVSKAIRLPDFSEGAVPLFFPVVIRKTIGWAASPDFGTLETPGPLIVNQQTSFDPVCGFLEARGIETRPLMPLLMQKPVQDYLMEFPEVSGKENFSGDKEVLQSFSNMLMYSMTCGKKWPVSAELTLSAFIIGCHPGMTDDCIQHVADCFQEHFDGQDSA